MEVFTNWGICASELHQGLVDGIPQTADWLLPAYPVPRAGYLTVLGCTESSGEVFLHYVLKEGMSFLDIGAGIGLASALAARTPSIRITAIEPEVSMRSVLRTNLALVLPAASAVPFPPVQSGGLRGVQDGLDLPEYIEFVKYAISSVSPAAIGLCGSHVELFLQFVCSLSAACVVVTETDQRPCATGSSQQVPLFPPNAWDVVLATTLRSVRGGPGRYGKFIRVAKRRLSDL